MCRNTQKKAEDASYKTHGSSDLQLERVRRCEATLACLLSSGTSILLPVFASKGALRGFAFANDGDSPLADEAVHCSLLCLLGASYCTAVLLDAVHRDLLLLSCLLTRRLLLRGRHFRFTSQGTVLRRRIHLFWRKKGAARRGRRKSTLHSNRGQVADRGDLRLGCLRREAGI